MRRARRLPKRLVRLTTLSACLALILTSVSMSPLPLVSGRGALPQGQGNQESNSKARKVTPEPPQPGPPSGALPNLDEIKQRRQPEPKAPAAIASTARSKRKPLESRQGRKVGDPPPRGRASGVSNPDASGIVAVASTRSSRVWPSSRTNVSLSNTLLAWNGDASILNLFSYPAFHSFNYS